MINFDELIDRNTPEDIKHAKIDGINDLIPMWVADMDFKSLLKSSRLLQSRPKEAYSDILKLMNPTIRQLPAGIREDTDGTLIQRQS